MDIKRLIQKTFTSLTGYTIINSRHGMAGVDLFQDLKYKFKIEPKVVFDVGANAGQTCERFLANFPTAIIHCFEPVSSTFESLRKTYGDHPMVITNHLALGNETTSKHIQIHDSSQSVLNSLKDTSMNSNSSAPVENIQIEIGDNYIEMSKVDQVDILKIDTEGYEIEVLEGFRNSLATNRIGSFPTPAVGLFALVSGILSIAMHFVFETQVSLSSFDWMILVLLGLGPLGAAFYLWDYAIKRSNPQEIGLLSFLTPLLSTGFLLVITGQALSWLLAIAAGLIVGGSLIGRARQQ